MPFKPIRAVYERPKGPPALERPVAAPPHTDDCSLQHLRITGVRIAAAPDQSLFEPAVENTGPSCALATAARARLLDLRREPIHVFTKTATGPGSSTSVRRMLVRPGMKLRVRVIVIGRGCRAIPREGFRIRMHVADGHVDTNPIKAPTCIGEGGGVATGPWLPQLPREYLEPAVPPRNPYDGSPLHADIQLPRVRQADTWLRFTVILRNRTGTPIPLEPCPAYTMAVYDVDADTGTDVAYQLNCADAPREVPAKGSLRFAMELPLPPSDRGVVDWILGVYGRGTAPWDRDEYRRR